MNYPYFNGYYNPYDARMQLEQQMKQQPAINQTFQLAPTNMNELDAKFVGSVNDVKNLLAMKDTLCVSPDYSFLWLKKADGSIKSYRMEEVIELDEKDKMILSLQKQIDELKGSMTNVKSDGADVNEQPAKKKSSGVSAT